MTRGWAAAALLSLLAFVAAPASAGPHVISGSENCSNCGDRNLDWPRYRNEAYNCALGSYNSSHCTSAKNVLVNTQYVGSSNKGVRVKICSTMSGHDYGCQNVDVYWDFTLPPLSTNAILALIADIIDDFDWHSITPPFTVLKGLSVKLVSPNGERHDVYYPDEELEDGHLTERDLPTYPPGLPYHLGHPLAPYPPGCPYVTPMVDVLGLDGRIVHRGRSSEVVLGEALAEDGRLVTQDQVEFEAAGLVVYHAGEHAMNERYAPTPAVSLAARRVSDDGSREGWAAIHMGASGAVRGVQAYAADGRSVAEIRSALAGAVSVVFPDRRRHDHTVYLVYAIDSEGTLTMRGEPLIALPMCCPPAPPPCPFPFDCDLE